MNQDQEAKVINLFAAKAKKSADPSLILDEEGTDFASIMKANAEKKNRMREERAKANRGVIRSYRLKK